jgi:hypothetical protein
VSVRRAILFVALLSAGCASTVRRNTPLEAASATIESTGFGRTTSSTVTTGFVESSVTVTRVGQAASVVEGPRGDQIWRLSEDGLTLQHCRLLDEQPTDCQVVPLTSPAYQPTILDPVNLGAAGYFAQDKDWAVASGGTTAPGEVKATPRFGVWVSSVPRIVLPTLFAGNLVLGGEISFCHVHAEKGPRCVSTKQVSSEVVGVHVIRSGDRLKHVVWAQPVGSRSLARCEADDESGDVSCKTTKEL